jgi:adenosylmethionine-8-amino-7-oxononanoate aminotransferase
MLGLSNLPAIELAEKLIKIAPKGLSRVFYSDSGSEAMEIALKIAFQYWHNLNQKSNIKYQKYKFLTLTNAYHGDTIGAVSLGGVDLYHSIYKPLLFSTIQAPSPYCYRCPLDKERTRCQLDCLKVLERLIKKHHLELAAVVIEPLIQCAGGMITQPKGYLKEIRRLCNQYDVLLIADEVATGFGHTGRMFACEHEGVTPDIMAIAKGLTGGYLPLAATLTTEKVFNAFLGEIKEQRTFYHGHTYTGNPLACAAALATLKIFERESILTKLQTKIKFLHKHLPRFYQLPSVGDIRQCGFIVGIELVKNKKTSRRSAPTIRRGTEASGKEPYSSEENIGHKVIVEARRRGVILRPLGNIIVLMPPLSINLSALRQLLSVTYDSIKTVTFAQNF